MVQHDEWSGEITGAKQKFTKTHQAEGCGHSKQKQGSPWKSYSKFSINEGALKDEAEREIRTTLSMICLPG